MIASAESCRQPRKRPRMWIVDNRPSFMRSKVMLCALLLGAGAASLRSAPPIGEWRAYAADKASTRYSPLDQINANTVKNLKVAWRQSSTPDEVPVDRPNVPRPFNYQHTPLMVGGLVYMSTGIGAVAALDAATGKVVWVEEPAAADGAGQEGRGRDGAPGAASRGLAFWTDDADARILTVNGSYLVALNAKTGRRYPNFGTGGRVDLRQGLSRPYDDYNW